MIGHLYGPISCKRYDCYLLRRSQLHEKLTVLLALVAFVVIVVEAWKPDVTGKPDGTGKPGGVGTKQYKAGEKTTEAGKPVDAHGKDKHSEGEKADAHGKDNKPHKDGEEHHEEEH